jgi:hypothetical protein
MSRVVMEFMPEYHAYVGLGTHALAPAWGLAPTAICRAVEVGRRAATHPRKAVLHLQSI